MYTRIGDVEKKKYPDWSVMFRFVNHPNRKTSERSRHMPKYRKRV